MTERIGQCAICGETRTLTFEHIPPKRAFNDQPAFTSRWEDVLNARSKAELQNLRRSMLRRGFGAHTLCQSCNNNTGAWYGPSYIRWAQQAAINQAYVEAGRIPLLFEIEPLLVYKMIITMFASACGPSLFENNSSLRRFVLSRDCRDFPKGISVYGHYTAYESSMKRQSGISGLLSLDHEGHSVFSEITTYPLSYVLNLKGSRVPDARLTLLDNFLGYGPQEMAMIRVPLVSLPINTMYPGDYRSYDEIWG